MAERRHQPASRLSGGQQQILAVAQGVIGDPQLLILDEPSGGLAPLVIDRILEVAAQLCAAGLAILLVEQLVEKALRHANYVYLIETGRVAAADLAHAMRDGALVRRVYLGRGKGGRTMRHTRRRLRNRLSSRHGLSAPRVRTGVILGPIIR